MTTPDPYRPTSDVPASPGTPGAPAADPLSTSSGIPYRSPSTPPPPPARTDSRGARHTGRVIGFGLAAALLVFVTVILVLFVLFNTQTVDVSLVFGDVQLPLVLALVLAAVLGGLIVGLASLAARARRSAR